MIEVRMLQGRRWLLRLTLGLAESKLVNNAPTSCLRACQKAAFLGVGGNSQFRKEVLSGYHVVLHKKNGHDKQHCRNQGRKSKTITHHCALIHKPSQGPAWLVEGAVEAADSVERIGNRHRAERIAQTML